MIIAFKSFIILSFTKVNIMQILNTFQMNQKIRRISFEILERNLGEEEIYFIGINNCGYALAQLLSDMLNGLEYNEIKSSVTRIRVKADQPTASDIYLEGIDVDELDNKCLILVDDVANTGRTLFYAFQPLLRIIPRKLEVAVMVDRKHKLFPVHVDYVGLSLATTLKENIRVDLSDIKNMTTSLN
ncbi:MAG TPA: phosphoribosyltransferase family protein [Saprospiraceae bacterium]|nr:phosphoribosyltransferase family protein [Saprospiraceae bacterium]